MLTHVEGVTAKAKGKNSHIPTAVWKYIRLTEARLLHSSRQLLKLEAKDKYPPRQWNNLLRQNSRAAVRRWRRLSIRKPESVPEYTEGVVNEPNWRKDEHRRSITDAGAKSYARRKRRYEQLCQMRTPTEF